MGSVQFQIVPCSSLYFFSWSIGPFQCLVNGNYRVLICCICHFQSSSLFIYFGFLCLQASSVSNFHPDTRGQRWLLIQAYLFNCAAGREEHCKKISLACVGSACSECMDHTGFALAHSMCAFLVYTAQAPGCSAGVLSEVGTGLRALPRPKPLGSGSRALHKAQTQLGLRFVSFPGPSSRGDQVLCECTLPEWGVRLIASLSQPPGNATSDVLCVSSGELIYGCNPPAGCQPSRIPGRLG